MRITPRLPLILRVPSPPNLFQRTRRQNYSDRSAVLHDFNAAQRRDVVEEPAEVVFRLTCRYALHILAILAKIRLAASLCDHLLKWIHFEQDTAGRDLELRYFHDVDRREVDFVVTESGRPIRLVECKWSDADIDGGLRYLHGKFPFAEAWQLSATGRKDYQTPDGIRVAPALELLKDLV